MIEESLTPDPGIREQYRHFSDLVACSLNVRNRVNCGLRLLEHGRGARVVEKEAQHLTRGVGASRIGVGSRWAATRPRVAGSMDVPLLEDCPPAPVGVDGAGVSISSWYPTMMHACLSAGSK
jgi:hypothetical protein